MSKLWLGTRELFSGQLLNYVDESIYDSMDNEKLNMLVECTLPILGFLPRQIPDYTDHGPLHANRVMYKCLDLILQAVSPAVLSPHMVFLLCASAWVHDIGNIIDRENHRHHSARLVERLWKEHYFIMLSERETTAISQVIEMHDTNDPLDQLETDYVLEPGTPEVNLQLLAALLRLADACDIDNRRAPAMIFQLVKEKLPESSKLHWIAHQNVEMCRYYLDIQMIKAKVRDIEKAKVATDIVEQRYGSVADVFKRLNVRVRGFTIETISFPELIMEEDEA